MTYSCCCTTYDSGAIKLTLSLSISLWTRRIYLLLMLPSQISNAHSTAVVLFFVSIGMVLFRRSTKNCNVRKNLLKWANNTKKDGTTPNNSSNQDKTVTNSCGSAVYDCFPPLPQEVVNLLRYCGTYISYICRCYILFSAFDVIYWYETIFAYLKIHFIVIFHTFYAVHLDFASWPLNPTESRTSVS
jgi:hypothetical protein